MSVKIVYTVDCHCGEMAESGSLYFGGLQEGDGSLRIDLELAASQETFECMACGCLTYTGDLGTYCETEFDCSGEDDSGDEEEAVEEVRPA